MAKLTEDELLRLACVYAERDQAALAESYDHMTNDPQYKRSMDFVRQIREYRMKRWGKKRHA